VLSEFEPEATLLLHSPRKHSAGPVFPPEYIFCEKVEIKGVDRKTERYIFSSWKNKEITWEQIESRAEKMGRFRLHRLVRSTDLMLEILPHIIRELRAQDNKQSKITKEY
jgi:hypothetical protein